MWKRYFIIPLVVVLGIVIAVTGSLVGTYGTVFLENVLVQFLATVIGAIFAILLAWGLWRLQRRAQKEQLKKDLISEAKVNSERIHDLEQSIVSVLEKKPGELTWDNPLIKSMLDKRYKLRTAAMKNITKPENLVLVSKLELADYLEWLLPHAELYNMTLIEALDRFWLARYKSTDVLASVIALNETIFPRIFQLQKAFDIIIEKERDLLRG